MWQTYGKYDINITNKFSLFNFWGRNVLSLSKVSISRCHARNLFGLLLGMMAFIREWGESGGEYIVLKYLLKCQKRKEI